jgi:leucyl aminopeptidase
MEFNITTKQEITQDVLVTGIFKEDNGTYKELNQELGKEIQTAIENKEFSLKKFGSSFYTRHPENKNTRVVVISLGEKEKFDTQKARRFIAKATTYTLSKKKKSFSTDIAQKADFLDHKLLGRALTEGTILASYKFDKYLTKDEDEPRITVKNVSLFFSKENKELKQGMDEGTIIANATNLTRDLVNEPARTATPAFIEQKAREVAEHKNITIKVLEKADMEKLGMGSMLGVTAGSDLPPKFIILEYKGAGEEPFKAIVGKGITFDTGGYSLKPSAYMDTMKCDMSGAAAVLGTIKAVSDLNIKKNILGVMPCCENAINGSAIKPSDILIAYNKKSIEVGNTDAEGRLILADALSYTEDKYKPEIMIDLATLTGACVVALGEQVAGLMTKEEGLAIEIEKAGLISYDRVWRLPMLEEYQDSMKGTISDVKNIAPKGHGAGSVTAAVFLSHFVKETPWAHIDIAGPAFLSKKANEYLGKDASGAGVRLLSYFFLN